jgi:hypothetical protein
LGAGRPLGGRNGLRHLACVRRRLTGPEPLRWPAGRLSGTETKVYIAIVAFLANLLVAAAVTVFLRALKVPSGVDHTHPDDYTVDVGDAGVELDLDLDAPIRA